MTHRGSRIIARLRNLVSRAHRTDVESLNPHATSKSRQARDLRLRPRRKFARSSLAKGDMKVSRCSSGRPGTISVQAGEGWIQVADSSALLTAEQPSSPRRMMTITAAVPQEQGGIASDLTC